MEKQEFYTEIVNIESDDEMQPFVIPLMKAALRSYVKQYPGYKPYNIPKTILINVNGSGLQLGSKASKTIAEYLKQQGFTVNETEAGYQVSW